MEGERSDVAPRIGPLAWLSRPVRATWLVWFRRTLGGAVLWETFHSYRSASWSAVHIDPVIRVPMPGLEFLQVSGGTSLHAVWLGIMVAAALTLVGRGGRLAPAVMALLLLVDFAQDASLYLNHHYLLVLLSLVAAFIPTVGARGTAPWSALFLVRFQITVPYVYASLAKFDPDWLTGIVMNQMLVARESTFGWAVSMPYQAEVMTLAGVFLDGLAPLMLWRGVGRRFAWAGMCVFHIANSGLFNIGVFPWLMLLITPVLLPDDTLPRLLGALRNGSMGQRAALLIPAVVLAVVGALWPANASVLTIAVSAWAGAIGGYLFLEPSLAVAEPPVATEFPRTHSLPLVVLAVWVVTQIVVPFRHLAIPGDVTWTEEGHRYSWRMLLRTKRVTSALIEVTNPATGDSWYLGPNDLLEPHQATDVLGRPDLVVGFARAIAKQWEEAGVPGVEVRLRVQVSLNRRPPVLMYDPSVDLAHVDASAPASWIQPTPRERWL